MNHSLSWMFASLMKVPFYVYFGHFWAIFGTFLNLSVSRIPCLLNWITSELNQQIFSESNNILNWVKQYWIKYWMNHFLAKFKHWIESDWVSPTTIYRLGLVLSANYRRPKIVPKLVESFTITSFWTFAYTNSLFCHFIQHGFWHLLGRDFSRLWVIL